MDCDTRHLRALIGAFHRRLLVLRCLEKVGVGLLWASLATLAVLPVLLWRSLPAGPFTIVLMAIGAAAGLVWGYLRRPSPLAAAMEADRQLRSDDLLSTAWLLRESQARSDLLQQVLGLAEQRCAATARSALLARRIGARGWSGIGLCLALCGLLTTLASDSTAVQDGSVSVGSLRSSDRRVRELTGTGVAVSLADERRSPLGAGQDEKDPLAAAVPPLSLGTASAAISQGSASGAGVSLEGTGAGAAVSKSQGGSDMSPSGAGAGESGSSSGAAGGGGAGSAKNNGASGASGVGAADSAKAVPAPPPWRASTWAADQQGAQSALRHGRVPDAYRPLVSDYFDVFADRASPRATRPAKP